MEELLALSKSPIRKISRYDKIEAKLIQMGKNFAIFDIGGKSEGVVGGEYFIEGKSLLKSLAPGDNVTATVMEPESPDGMVVLSLRQASDDMFWENLEKAYEDNKEIKVIGRSASDRGLVVDIKGYPGFIPSSQITADKAKNIHSLVGKEIKVKPIEIDKDKNRIVLSEKEVSEEQKIEKLKKALKDVKKGQIFEGKVIDILPFGAFVEIEVGEGKKKTNVEGLVHVSEISWARVERPADYLEKGQKVKVIVLGVDGGRLALSMREAKEDPWNLVENNYKVDDKIEGKILKMGPSGMSVELEPGIEGFVHITKIPPGSKFEIGEKVKCYIDILDKESRKINLGLVITTAKPLLYK